MKRIFGDLSAPESVFGSKASPEDSPDSHQMKILQIHNRYLSGLGGEDVALEADRALLAGRGHKVTQFFGSNAEFGTARGVRRMSLGANAIWSRRAFDELRSLLRAERPEIAHVHNTFAQLSASIYWALADEGIPVVQTVQNYRWMCAVSTFLRDGRPCERCLGHVQVPAIVHGCSYNGSRAAGLVIATANAAHSALGTYKKKIHAVIALTEFMRAKLLTAGIDASRLHVRPNFTEDPGSSFPGYESRENTIVFVGQIDEQKGVEICAEAFSLTGERNSRLLMIGEGKLRPQLMQRYKEDGTIAWLGKVDRPAGLNAMSASRFLVLPSLWYEGLPLVVLEAMSRGTPVIVPNHGAFPEIVDDGLNGIVFRAGDVSSLHLALKRALSMSADQWTTLSWGARSRFLERYSPATAYDSLMAIYDAARKTALA